MLFLPLMSKLFHVITCSALVIISKELLFHKSQRVHASSSFHLFFFLQHKKNTYPFYFFDITIIKFFHQDSTIGACANRLYHAIIDPKTWDVFNQHVSLHKEHPLEKYQFYVSFKRFFYFTFFLTCKTSVLHMKCVVVCYK